MKEHNHDKGIQKDKYVQEQNEFQEYEIRDDTGTLVTCKDN